MIIVYSALRRRAHNYDGHRSDERCNLDQIRGDDRKTIDTATDAGREVLPLLTPCRRCFPAGIIEVPAGVTPG